MKITDDCKLVLLKREDKTFLIKLNEYAEIESIDWSQIIDIEVFQEKDEKQS